MTQQYVGIKQVTGWEQEQNGKPGYAVKYEDGYISWSPKETFEKFYSPMGEGNQGNIVTEEMVDAFIVDLYDSHIGATGTQVTAQLKNGTFLTATTGCVDPANYNHATGVEICVGKIKDQVWELLGFAVRWSLFGVKPQS